MPLLEVSLGFTPTPPSVIAQALDMAEVTSADLVFDLGSGDGRIVIAAAATCGARGVGVEVDERLIEDSEAAALRCGVQDRVTFIQGDLFETDMSQASVVFLALMPEANLELRSKLIETLRVGSRIVAFYWDMRDWKPEKQIEVDHRTIYLWRITDEVKCRRAFDDSFAGAVHFTRKVGNRKVFCWTRETDL